MPFMSLLIEAAGTDLKYSPTKAINESAVIAAYKNLESAPAPIQYPAEMIPVVKVGEGYYTEMSFLMPYMKSNGVKSVVTALNDLAKANGLNEGAVGLLVESKESVMATIDDAIDEKHAGAAIAKLSKADQVIDNLSKNGVKVVSKADQKMEDEKDKDLKAANKGSEECCKECGKPMSQCVCGK